MHIDESITLPLWLLYEDEIDAWRASQPPLLAAWIAAHGFQGERHRVICWPGAAGELAGAVAGLGRRHGALSLWHAAGIAERLPARRFCLAQRFSDTEATQLGLGFAYAAYRFERYRALKPQGASLEIPANAEQRYIALAAEAAHMARDWINTPAADFGPAQLAAAVRRIGERHQARLREWQGEELLQANLPAIHAVGRAASAAPRLIELTWAPEGGAESLPRVTLIGKGVCFDTGGLDLKPSAGMALMKKDMGGAAVALALAHMLMSARARIELRLLVPAVENSLAGNSYRPGDVLSTHKGLTVEVGNTDAEGRLVLCDALALADEAHPHLVIDLATLTGAARVALGPELPALFGNDEKLVRALAAVAAEEADPLWPMPLWAGYEDELSSKIADLNNVAPTSFAGAIFGALFLKRFIGDATPWVHVDLYAWNPKERPGRPVGAEPQALRALYRYLIGRFGTL